MMQQVKEQSPEIADQDKALLLRTIELLRQEIEGLKEENIRLKRDGAEFITALADIEREDNSYN